MSHIVVYESADGASGFERCGSLDAAIVAAERLRNVEGVNSPRIFKLEEVQFDFRPYFRVEVNEGDADPSPTALERTVIPEPPVMAAPEVAAPIESLMSEPEPEPEPDPEPESESEEPIVAEPVADPFAEMSEPEPAVEAEPVETTDWVGGDDDASTFDSEAELEAIFATDPEPVPENTGEALFDSLQDDAPDPASVFNEVADEVAEEAPVVEVPEPDSMVSVRKGLFGR